MEIHQLAQNLFGATGTRDREYDDTVKLKFVATTCLEWLCNFQQGNFILLSKLREQDGGNIKLIFTFWVGRGN
jgi:hypothetical protein